MKLIHLFAALFSLMFFAAGRAEPLDKARLDQFFDRLAEKNKAMGSLVIARDGQVLYSRAIGYGQIHGTERTPLTESIGFGSDRSRRCSPPRCSCSSRRRGN